MTPRLGGLWIVLEGIDGAGKTTMVDAVEKLYKEKGREVVRVREPGGTPLGERLRSLFLECKADGTSDSTEDVLMLVAAKHALFRQVVLPALERGAVVIADRWSDTLYAYQGGGFGVETAMISGILRCTQMTCMPDLMIYMDISPENAAKRLQATRNTFAMNRLDTMPKSFYRRVRAVYRQRTKASVSSFLVHAGRPFENVFRSVKRVLKENGAL